ncbi:TonB-dependent receptor plug domain-containing protein, partial [Pseudomonas syringae group genomosp. 7]
VKDLVGVFSGDARNSGALDINIRGIQGPGRVPVSIDGGEQALTVWRGYNGVSNRNYIDPNLIGGIQVIKGPGLVRDVHSG